MKKLMVVCLMMLLVLSMGVNVFAAQDGFVSSPSGNSAPNYVSFNASNEECSGQLVITAYSDKDTLAADKKSLLENAYTSIVEAGDLTELNADLATIAANENLDVNYLAVSDLFDLSIANCENHENHVGFGIILQADTLDNFVGLLHMNNDGAWELVEDAAVIYNGEYLEFSVDTLSPFAIVVDTFVPEYIAGDIDDNGSVNAKDVTILRRFLAEGWNVEDGAGFVAFLANVNYPKDNIVNAEDVTLLRRFISEGFDVELVLPESEVARQAGTVNSVKYSNNMLNSESYEVSLSASAASEANGSNSNGVIYFCITAMAVSAIALVVILVKNKKNV